MCAAHDLTDRDPRDRLQDPSVIRDRMSSDSLVCLSPSESSNLGQLYPGFGMRRGIPDDYKTNGPEKSNNSMSVDFIERKKKRPAHISHWHSVINLK